MTTVSEVLITIGPGGADVANFGNVLAGTAQVSGVIRHDLDADGQVNLGYEPGLGGRRVFSDANRNGLWDANEPSTFSDYSGSYLLKGLLAGTHRIVCAVPDAGWVSTTPAAAEVTLGVGGGAQQFFMQAQKSLIAGYVFDDRDRDGVAIKGEPLLAGWQVYMDENGNGRYDGGERIAMTDANGRYEFAGVFARKYSIGVTLAVDWAAISPSYVMLTPPVGGTGKLDFAVANRTQGVAWGGARRFDTTPSRPAPGVRVFDDLDGDGLWDGDELFTFTADSGLWTLGGLSAGAHTLRAEGSSTIRSVTIVGEQRQFVPSFMLH
jgi:hypothetical protein